MNCYKFNGTSWTSVFTDIGSGSTLADEKLQIQFNGSSTVRVAGTRIDGKITIIERDLSGAGPNLVGVLYYNPLNHTHYYRYDYTSFSKYYLSWSNTTNNSRVARKLVGTAAGTEEYTESLSVTTMRNVSGIADEDYLAALDYKGTNNPPIKNVKVYHAGSNILTTLFSDDILKFRKNILDDQLYLMYSDDTHNLTFQKYNKATSVWSAITPIGLNTSAANFFTDMEINPVDNGIYAYYLDGEKISVKVYTVSLCTPTNVQINNITMNTANVTWNAPVTSTTNWEIALVPQAQPISNGTLFSSNTNSFTLTGMTANTSYDVYVRALCGGTLSDWTTPVNFITQNLPIYVDLNATAGALDGTSWTDAYTNIQDAIDNTNSGQQIWVAQGTYMPTTNLANTRKATYAVDKILSIYGGFQGNETQLSQRDAAANITILSGDLNADDDNTNIVHNETTRSENVYHIISLVGNFNSGTIIDGFTITGGNANGTTNHVSGATGYDDKTSGAIYTNPNAANNRISAEIKNCIIEKNTAEKHAVIGTYSPSGATGTYSKIDFTSTIIKNNSSGRSILGYGASAQYDNSRFGDIINCLITNNENTLSNYAAVLLAGSTTTQTAPTCAINIINTTIANNTSASVYVLSFTKIDIASKIDNSIIYNNGGSTLIGLYGTNDLTSSNSIIEGGHLGALNVDPKFNNVLSGDYSLDVTSPAIDTGNNTLLSALIAKDVTGNNRIFNTTIDMGALEYFSTVGVHDLTVSKIGSGFVTPTVGVHSYNDGTVVNLTAAPATGWVFDKWSGDINSTNSSETITINANKSVIAEFKQIQHTLTVNTVGNGTVTRSIQPVNGTYNYGTGVTLTAIPAAGFQFGGWSGASTQITLSTVVIMDADKTVTAQFSPIQYELTIIENDGIITPNTGTLNNGVYTYNPGTIVEINAVTNTGFVFDHYEITDSNGTTTNAVNPLSITMSDHTVVEAIYTATYDLTTNVVGSGSVSPSGTTAYNDGTVVSVTATPIAGWSFDGWSGASSSVAATINITMDADKTLTANFSPIQYELTIIANNGVGTPDSGTLIGGVYTYNANTSVQITAVANTGYVFHHYNVIDSNGSTTSTTNPLSITMNDHTSVEAII